MSTIEQQLAGLPVTVKVKLMGLVDGSIGLSQDEKRLVQELLRSVVWTVKHDVDSPVAGEAARLLQELGQLVWAAQMAADGRDPSAAIRAGRGAS